MDPSNLTTRSQDALSTAVRRAAADGNPQVDTLHLLAALLAQPESTAAALLRAVGSDPRQVAEAAEDEIGKLPAATGSSVTAPSLARPVYEVLQRAADLAEELGDEYVSTEHLTVGLATVDSPAKTVLEKAGATAKALEAGFETVRGSARVTSPDPEGTYQALEKYGIDLTAQAKDGKLDPVIGRDAEIRRVVQVLTRRTKNNPVLIGEPGVG